MSQAEPIVFELLADVPLATGIAFHSLSISEHEYKRWGELDFAPRVTNASIGIVARRDAAILRDGRLPCRPIGSWLGVSWG